MRTKQRAVFSSVHRLALSCSAGFQPAVGARLRACGLADLANCLESRSSAHAHQPRAVSLTLALALVLCIGTSRLFAAAAPDNTPHQITVTPELSNEILINPGMGWQYIGYLPLKDEAEKMPEISTFYTRASWADFEPEPGKDGPIIKMIDQWLDYAAKHHRYVGLRAVTYSVGSKTSLVPDYVWAAGAKNFPEPNGSGALAPEFWDKTYIDLHCKFIERLGAKYGKNPALAYIDIPGGNWGEMNLRTTGIAQLDDLSAWKAHGLTPASWNNMLFKLADAYKKAFPGKLIICAADYGSYGDDSTHPNMIDQRGIGLRDDGLGMSYSTAGKKNPEFEQYWPKVPCFFENGYIDWTSWGDRKMVDGTLNWAIDQCHASIVTVGKNEGALKAYTTYKDLVTKLGVKLGYRFEIQQASYFSHARKNNQLTVDLRIKNAGNAPMYQDGKIEISFVAADGRVLGAVLGDPTPPVQKWLPGDPVNAKVTVTLPGLLPNGPTRMCIGLVNASDQEQRLQLPLKTTVGDRRYLLGDIVLLDGTAPANAGGDLNANGGGGTPARVEDSPERKAAVAAVRARAQALVVKLLPASKGVRLTLALGDEVKEVELTAVDKDKGVTVKAFGASKLVPWPDLTVGNLAGILETVTPEDGDDTAPSCGAIALLYAADRRVVAAAGAMEKAIAKDPDLKDDLNKAMSTLK